MFLRKGNRVRVDYRETAKESRIGVIDEFNQSAIVVNFEDNNERAFIPYTSITELVQMDMQEAHPAEQTTQF